MLRTTTPPQPTQACSGQRERATPGLSRSRALSRATIPKEKLAITPNMPRRFIQDSGRCRKGACRDDFEPPGEDDRSGALKRRIENPAHRRKSTPPKARAVHRMPGASWMIRGTSTPRITLSGRRTIANPRRSRKGMEGADSGAFSRALVTPHPAQAASQIEEETYSGTKSKWASRYRR